MKKILLILVTLSFVLMASVCYAHPPSDITITYDPATKILKAVIIHEVSNPVNHYISKISVGLNDKEILVQNLAVQDNSTNQQIMYLIPDVKTGDQISVEGTCSISGKLKKEIKLQ